MRITAPSPAPTPRAHRPAPSGTDIGGLLTILGRRLPSIAAITLGSLALASLYLWVTPPTYTASTTLLIDPRPKKVVTEEGQGGLGTDLALLESQVAIIRSDAVLSRVVDNEKLKLAEDPEFAPQVSTTGIKAQLKALLGMKSADTDPKSQALAALAQHVVVKRAQKTYVVEIEASSSQPVKAARLTQAIVDAYLEDQTTAKAEDAKRANALIDGRLGELREQVRKAETRVDEFRKTNSILTSEGGTVGEQQLTKLNTELITARSQAAEAKARADEVTAAAKTGNPDVITDPAKQGLVQRLREQQATVARREASLASQLMPKHPVLVDIRSQLTEIKTQIANELKRVAATAKAEYQIAENREKELTKTLETAKSEVGRTNTAQIKMRELEGEVAASRELLRIFLARSKETDEQQKITTPDARIISQPSVPTRPSKPVPALILALGLLGGLAAGIARALALDHVNTSLQTARDVEASTGLRTLAVMAPPKTAVAVGPAGRSARADGPIAGSPFAPLAEALTKSKGRSLIGYRQSCLGVLSQIRSDGSRASHTVLVAAPEVGSGSSVIAFSLAYAAANQGDRVLLIDAASGEPALSEGISCPVPTDRAVKLHDAQDLASITTRDPRCGLVVLPIALADLPSLKQLQRQRLLQGLRDLSASFDLVVIDGGAVLEDESASIVLPLATQVILVARTGATQAASLTAAAFQLDAARNRIVGVVLT
jgi:polysaccharide biosynthesis transport protein